MSQNEILFSHIALQQAYNYLNFYSDTAKHYIFNIVSGDITGTYWFKTGFYGLTVMPAEFQ